jgi:hypothetical protein
MLGWPLIDLITCPRLSLRSHAALPWGGAGESPFPLDKYLPWMSGFHFHVWNPASHGGDIVTISLRH